MMLTNRAGTVAEVRGGNDKTAVISSRVCASELAVLMQAVSGVRFTHGEKDRCHFHWTAFESFRSWFENSEF